MKFARLGSSLQICFSRDELELVSSLSNVTLHCEDCGHFSSDFHQLAQHMAICHREAAPSDLRHFLRQQKQIGSQQPFQPSPSLSPSSGPSPACQSLGLMPKRSSSVLSSSNGDQQILARPLLKRARNAAELPKSFDITNEPCSQWLPVVELKPDLSRVVSLNKGDYVNYPSNEQFATVAEIYQQFLASRELGTHYADRLFDAGVTLAEHLGTNVSSGRQVDLVFQLGKDVAKCAAEAELFGGSGDAASPEELARKLFHLSVQLLQPNSQGHINGEDACSDIVSCIRAVRHYIETPSLERLTKLEESARDLSLYVGRLNTCLTDLSQSCVISGQDSSEQVCRMFVCMQMMVIKCNLKG